MLLAGGPDGDFNILAESREELHLTSDREVARAIPHQYAVLKLAQPALPFRSTAFAKGDGTSC